MVSHVATHRFDVVDVPLVSLQGVLGVHPAAAPASRSAHAAYPTATSNPITSPTTLSTTVSTASRPSAAAVHM